MVTFQWWIQIRGGGGRRAVNETLRYGGSPISKKFILAFRASLWSKSNGGGPPGLYPGFKTIFRPMPINPGQSWILDSRGRIPCQWNLNSGFQSLAIFLIHWAEFQIPKPRIPDSKRKNFSRFWNLDNLTWGKMIDFHSWSCVFY